MYLNPIYGPVLVIEVILAWTLAKSIYSYYIGHHEYDIPLHLLFAGIFIFDVNPSIVTFLYGLTFFRDILCTTVNYKIVSRSVMYSTCARCILFTLAQILPEYSTFLYTLDSAVIVVSYNIVLEISD